MCKVDYDVKNCVYTTQWNNFLGSNIMALLHVSVKPETKKAQMFADGRQKQVSKVIKWKQFSFRGFRIYKQFITPVIRCHFWEQLSDLLCRICWE